MHATIDLSLTSTDLKLIDIVLTELERDDKVSPQDRARLFNAAGEAIRAKDHSAFADVLDEIETLEDAA